MSASALATGARERLQRVASAAGEHDLDVLLVSGAVNVRYVTGFSGTTGLVLIAAGRTESEVALALELRMRRGGAEGPSFPPIVAAGAHAALPHAQPRGQEIARDVLVTIDWGALHEGYCSDCTRTFATGEGITAHAREIYEVVRAAQQQAAEAVRAGESGRELDAIARARIEQAGHGEHFGHGLGHGV